MQNIKKFKIRNEKKIICCSKCKKQAGATGARGRNAYTVDLLCQGHVVANAAWE